MLHSFSTCVCLKQTTQIHTFTYSGSTFAPSCNSPSLSRDMSARRWMLRRRDIMTDDGQWHLLDPETAHETNSWVLVQPWVAHFTQTFHYYSANPHEVGTSEVPFLDGTTWPQCPWTKGMYLRQGGTIVSTKQGDRIVKPLWVCVVVYGQRWDWCIVCKKYCVFNHVSDPKHWQRLLHYLVLCVPSAVPRELNPRPSDDEPGRWL